MTETAPTLMRVAVLSIGLTCAPAALSITDSGGLLGNSRARDQQQYPFSFGIMGGYKRTPFSGTIRSSALNREASGGLEESGGSLGLEARYNFRLPQMPAGAQPFAYVNYFEHFSLKSENSMARFHFGAQNDSGVAVDEKRSFGMGVGARWMFSPGGGLEFMAGAHATRMSVSAFSDERSGGGPYNQFDWSGYKWGPSVSIGLTQKLFTTESGGPIVGTIRYTGMYMPGVDVSGQSPFTRSVYTGHVDRGWQHGIQVGVLFR